jgi:hypothetical protein
MQEFIQLYIHKYGKKLRNGAMNLMPKAGILSTFLSKVYNTQPDTCSDSELIPSRKLNIYTFDHLQQTFPVNFPFARCYSRYQDTCIYNKCITWIQFYLLYFPSICPNSFLHY